MKVPGPVAEVVKELRPGYRLARVSGSFSGAGAVQVLNPEGEPVRAGGRPVLVRVDESTLNKAEVKKLRMRLIEAGAISATPAEELLHEREHNPLPKLEPIPVVPIWKREADDMLGVLRARAALPDAMVCIEYDDLVALEAVAAAIAEKPRMAAQCEPFFTLIRRARTLMQRRIDEAVEQERRRTHETQMLERDRLNAANEART